jgi:hypothetical protein
MLASRVHVYFQRTISTKIIPQMNKVSRQLSTNTTATTTATTATTTTPFYSGMHGKRNFNDEHPVLAVLTFCVLFGSGAGSFKVFQTAYEYIQSSAKSMNISVEFYDITDDVDE